MRKRGEITVFLSLSLVCILSLVMGLLESSRTTGARLYAQIAADSAMASVMSQYNRNLWDQYHVLFLEAGSNEAIQQSFCDYLDFYLQQENWYPMKPKHIEVTDTISMLDDGGIWLEKSILSYMKTRWPAMLDEWGDFSEVTDQLEGYENGTSILRQNLEQLKEMLKEEQEETQGEGEAKEEEASVDWDLIKVIFRLVSWFQGEILQEVLPEGVVVSNKRVSLRNIPSKHFSPLKESAQDVLWINEYCLLNFDSFLERCEKKIPIEEPPLSYEQEYLLFGRSSDWENLSETIEKLLAVRGTMNLVCLSNTPQQRAEADALAGLISGGNVAFAAAISLILLTLWAFGEAVIDVKQLLKGGRVPFWKNEDQWNLDLDALLEFRFLEPATKTAIHGQDYTDHLRVLFFFLDRKERNYRMMDVIQWNIRTVQDDFSVRDCKYKVEVKAELKEQHVFLTKSTYQRTVETVGSY